MRIDEALQRHASLGLAHPYIKYIHDNIRGLKPERYSPRDEQEYCNVLPGDLMREFKLHLEVDLNLNNTFLLIFIGHVLSKNPGKCDSRAVAEFFMKLTQNRQQDITQEGFDRIFNRVLEVNLTGCDIPNEMLLRFQNFITLTPYHLTRHTSNIMMLLRNVVFLGNREPVDFDAEIDEDSSRSTIAYITLKRFFDRRCTEEEIQNMFLLSIAVFGTFTDTIVDEDNIAEFFSQVLLKFRNEIWFKPKVLRGIILTKNAEVAVRLLKSCDKGDYYSIVRGLINHYVTCADKQRPCLQEFMHMIINDPHGPDDYVDKERQKVVDRIVHQSLLRLADCKHDEKINIMNYIVDWLEWKDLNLRRTFQHIFNADEHDRITIHKLIALLERSIDLHWYDEEYNRGFIKIILNIFYARPQIVLDRNVKMIELLCLRAIAPQMVECLPYIVKVIRKVADKNPSLLKPLLTILVHFSITPTEIGKKFLTEIHNLVHNAVIRYEDADTEFVIIGALISDEMKGVKISTALDLHSPYTHEQLMVLFEERTLKYGPVAWPFLCMLLDKYHLDTFPIHFQQILNDITHVRFYAKSEAVYIIQSIHKIFIVKDYKGVNREDKALASKLTNIFSHHIVSSIVPSKLANEVLYLLHHLVVTMKNNNAKLNKFKFECIKDVLTNYKTEGLPIIIRKLSYLAHMIIPFQINVSNENKTKIKKILESPGDLDPLIISKFILLQGRICIKYNRQIEETINILKGYLDHECSEVIVTTLATLYDISEIRGLDFASIEQLLVKLIRSHNVPVQTAALKLFTNVLTTNQLELHRPGIVHYLLVLAKKSIKSDIFIKDSLEKEQLMKCDQLIKGAFVEFLFFVNEYTEIEKYKVDLTLRTPYSYKQRCLIYRHLFGSLQRLDQLYVLKLLATEFITPLYEGALEIDFKSLHVLRDSLVLVSLFATDNLEKIDKIDDFYEEFNDRIKTILAPINKQKTIDSDFELYLGTIATSLLNMLSKLDRTFKEMVPQIYNAIGLLTEAYFDDIATYANNHPKLRELYCVYNSFFQRYKQYIYNEALSVKTVADQEEWELYVD